MTEIEAHFDAMRKHLTDIDSVLAILFEVIKANPQDAVAIASEIRQLGNLKRQLHKDLCSLG